MYWNIYVYTYTCIYMCVCLCGYIYNISVHLLYWKEMNFHIYICMKRLQRLRTIVFMLYANVGLIFGSFLVRFWCWFGFKNQNQNQTKIPYTNLWFVFGLVLVWFKPEPKPYQNHTDICTHVCTYIIIPCCKLFF